MTQTLKKLRLDAFFAAYEPRLLEDVLARPTLYSYPASEVPAVMARLRNAVERRGTFKATDKNTDAVKAVCKQLGVKHTYKAIDEWLASGPSTREEEAGQEIDFESFELAMARAREDGARWFSGLVEPKHVTLYRESKGTPGAFGFCVVFQRSVQPVTWCRAPWLYSHDGLPANVVDLVCCDKHAPNFAPSCLYCNQLQRLAVRS